MTDQRVFLRPVSLADFLSRFEPNTPQMTGQALDHYWRNHAVENLANAATEMGLSSGEVRTHTLRMLRESTARLQAAREACEGLQQTLPEGVRAVIAVGSAPRGEAVNGSDIDFNVYVSEELMRSLWSKRDKKAKTAHNLLRNSEHKLRSMIQPRLLRRLQELGFCQGEDRLALKPYSDSYLVPDRTPERGIPAEGDLAFAHLRNVLFASTAAIGEETFGSLLARLLEDSGQVFTGVLGRVSFLAAAQEGLEQIRSGSDGHLEKIMHEVAASISAIICAGLVDADPQVPYWWTLDQIEAHFFPTAVRSAFLHYMAIVTVARGGGFIGEPVTALQAIQSAVTALPLAVDAMIERMEEDGEDETTIQLWSRIADLLLDPEEMTELARDLGDLR